MAEEESAEHYLQVMAGHARQLWQWMRGAEQRVRQMFSNQQRRRIMIEGGNSRRNWDRDLDVQTRDIDPRDRTRTLESAADAQLREARALEEGNRDLEVQRQSLQQEADASAERLRQQEAQLNEARDRDAAEKQIDANGNDKPDWEDREDEAVQQDEADQVTDDVQAAQDEQARQDEAKRKQQEEDRRRDQQREDGVDAADAVPAAVGAAEAASALDNELNEDRAGDLQDPAAQAENLQQAETDVTEQEQLNPGTAEQSDLQQQDPAAQAENLQQAETDVAEQDQVTPGAAQQAGLDTDPQQNNQLLDEDGALRDSTIGAEGQQQDTDLAQTGEFVDQDGAVRNQTIGAEDQQQGTDLAQGGEFVDQDGAVRNQTIGAEDQQQDTDLAQGGEFVDQDGAVRNQTIGAEDQQQDTDLAQGGEFVDQDGAVRSQTIGAEGEQQDDLTQTQQTAGPDQQLSGQEPEVAAPEAQQVQVPEQGQQQVQASEQGMGEQNANQAGQQLNAQQVGNAAQSGVDQSASLGSDEQGQSGQESQAQSQWRPPAEEPVLDEQRAKSGPNQPGSEIPPGERDTLTRTQQGQAPAAGATSREGGGVATSERPGTPAQQRGQDRNRGDRGRDDTGRER